MTGIPAGGAVGGGVTITRHFVTTPSGRQVHYRRAGQGPAIVLCHESPLSSVSLADLVAWLSRRFTVIAIDNPGYGSSDKLDHPDPLIGDYAEALAETLDALGIRRAQLYGAHTGAFIVLEFAIRYPERCAGLITDGLPVFDPDDTVAVTNIRRAGEHLLRMVQDLIDVSQVEAGTLAVDTEAVALGPVVEQVRHLTAHEAERGTVTLVTRIDDVSVRADPTRLVQVLVNVVSNAVKYSPAGSVVGLSTAVSDDHVRIRIADAGPGIPPEYRERLFDPFDRLGAEHSHIPGTGIGLTVARQLVTAMHGRLELTSSSSDGSVFEVVLPQA